MTPLFNRRRDAGRGSAAAPGRSFRGATAAIFAGVLASVSGAAFAADAAAVGASVQAKRPTNYLGKAAEASDVASFFEVGRGEVVTAESFLNQLLAAGIPIGDARQNGYAHQHAPDAVRAAAIDDELSAHSLDYFGVEGVSPSEAHDRIKQQNGYTSLQYLAYARVGFGIGRCASARVGSKKCPVTIADIQNSIVKNLDNIPNLRYPGEGSQYDLTYAVNREDIAYRLMFDRIAQKFGGYPYNPLRDIAIDVSNPRSYKCRQLETLYANGAALEAWLNTIPGMPPTVSHTSSDLTNGFSEIAKNKVSGRSETYRYGLFNFMSELNCSRISAPGTCYAGEPLMAEYLLGEKGVTPSREDGDFRWSCSEIATIFETTSRNPYANFYDVLATQSTYQFDPATYPLRNDPIALNAEDVLMFFVANSNAYPNAPYDPFSDAVPLVDVQAMRDAGLLNAEFEFQFRVIPAVFNSFLR